MNQYEKALNNTEEKEDELIGDVEKESTAVYFLLKAINAEFVDKASVDAKLSLSEANKYNRLDKTLQKMYNELDKLKLNTSKVDNYLKEVADINFNATADELSDILQGKRISINKPEYDDLINTVFKNSSIENNIARAKIKLEQEVKQAVTSEEGIRKLNRRSKSVVEEATNNNETIIKTQTTKTMNDSRLLGMKKANDKVDATILKDWVSRRDEKVRQSHVEMDNHEPIPLDETFPNGLMYPGDPAGSPSEIINCRCEIEHVVKS